MRSYVVKARMPKNTRLYFNYFKYKVLERCENMGVDCVVELLDGRIVVFTDLNDPDLLFESIRGYISYHPVQIFENFEKLLDEILKKMNGCKTFAIRSNKKALEKEIGARVVEKMGLKVNLADPDCPIYVEKRGKFYILF